MPAGSKDTTVIIWDIVGITRTGRLRSRIGQAGSAGASGSLPLRQTPRLVLHGHEDAVTCLTLAPDLDLIVSAAADGTLLFHTLASGRCAHPPSTGCCSFRSLQMSKRLLRHLARSLTLYGLVPHRAPPSESRSKADAEHLVQCRNRSGTPSIQKNL